MHCCFSVFCHSRPLRQRLLILFFFFLVSYPGPKKLSPSPILYITTHDSLASTYTASSKAEQSLTPRLTSVEFLLPWHWVEAGGPVAVISWEQPNFREFSEVSF